jgi:UDP-N-acetylmuramoyl-tripeptide--D-alanyl-D-alanine ligase
VIETELTHLAAVTGGRIVVPGDAERHVVDEVTTDSRAVPPGRTLFVALRGEHADGHDHGGAAVAAGATAVMLEHEPEGLAVPAVVVADTWTALRRLGHDVRVRVGPTAVAITGSVGKTTVKDLTAAAVAAGRRTHAARGSFNNELGVPLTLCGLRADTEVLVAEIGARHVGDIADLAPLVAPDVAVVTAVAPVHLEVFGTIEAIARAKAELVGSLGPEGTAVLNLADPRVAAMADGAPATITVATDRPDADVHATDVVLDRLAKPRGTAVTPWGEVELRLPVAGRHQLDNALFALAVAGHLGVDLSAAAAALADAPVSPWRGEVTEVAGITLLNDAYNANPTSVVAALRTLVAIERTGRTFAVLGEMAEIGPTAAAEHEGIGRRCAELGVDHLVAVGDVAAAYAEGVASEAAATGDGPEVTRVADAGAATAALRDLLVPGDVVLVKASRVAGLERVARDLAETLTGGTEGGSGGGAGVAS